MPDPPASETESDFVCARDEPLIALRDMGLLGGRVRLCTEPFYRDHDGKRYCVLHIPGKKKSADFERALQRKLENEDFDFSDVWFPDKLSFEEQEFRAEANFSCATFSAAADFSSATFSANAYFRDATFSAEAYFRDATFSAEADFSSATFNAEADFRVATFGAVAYFMHATFKAAAAFSDATFSDVAFFMSVTFRAAAAFSTATFSAAASFSRATFSAAVDFRYATFSAEAEFRSATFSAEADFSDVTFNAETYFSTATFADHVRFAGVEKHQEVFTDTSQLDLQFARIEKPDRVSFHTLSLRPHWFVNIDARKFGFTNVDWGGPGINEKISRLKKKKISSPHHLLAIACRNLAVNAEDNHRYDEASKFRYMAMEARRLESWRGFAPWRLSWWYWLASGYGERVLRAFVGLLGIWFVAGLLHTQVGFARWEPRIATEGEAATANRDNFGTPLPFSRALTYSAGVLTFQRPEPKPATTAAQTLVLLETILGPVQAALLALAIRRKFMR